MSETEPKQERRRAWVWWAGGLAALLVLCAALQPVLLPRPSPATRAAYERIEMGMTRAEVERILGGPPGTYETGPTVVIYEGRGGPSGGLDWPDWRGDEGVVEVGFDPGGVATDKRFRPEAPTNLGYLDLVRFRLSRLKDDWFPPSP